MNLYKRWSFTDSDFTIYSTLKDFMYEKWVSSSYIGDDVNDYYNNYYSGSIPKFPGLNVKYASHSNDIVPYTDPNTEVMDDNGYVLSYNYKLGNGERFYPLYESQSGYINPDGSYEKMVYYSLMKLFYAPNATYHHLLFGSSNVLYDEAIVIEIPQRYVADTIEPGTFVFRDSSDIYNLPYSSGSEHWQNATGSNNVDTNPHASEGIKLVDDKLGNLFDANFEPEIQRGNIFYQMGLIVITDINYARYLKEYLIPE